MTEPRPAQATVKFVDDYCQWYESLFPEVRSFEAFKHLHIGMISDIKRKSLPAIAKVAGLAQEQSLHHFLTIHGAVPIPVPVQEFLFSAA